MAKESFEIDMPAHGGSSDNRPSVKFEIRDGDELITIWVRNRYEGSLDWILMDADEARRLAKVLIDFAARARDHS